MKKGYIYKRGAVYWLQYTVDGKRARCSLGADNVADARKRRDKILESIPRDRNKAVEALVRQLEETERKPIPFEHAWSSYVKHPNRLTPGAERTLKGYRAQWMRFLSWVQERGLKISNLSDVGKQVQSGHNLLTIAQLYARHLQEGGLSPSAFNQHIRSLRNMWLVLG